MRLGSVPVPSDARDDSGGEAYGPARSFEERHRHRFEFNNDYRDVLGAQGLVFSGLSPDGRLVEIAEIADHPFMVGSQFHPEFLSRPNRPHPLFRGFVQAVAERAGVLSTAAVRSPEPAART